MSEILTHADLVQRAVRWLRSTRGCTVVFAETANATALYIPDAIGWKRGWSMLVECKASRADFRADRKKPIHLNPDGFPGQERWYLTPAGLVTPAEIPGEWGLLEIRGSRIFRVKDPPRDQPYRVHRVRAEADILLAACRRHQGGVRWIDAEARFQSVAAARAEDLRELGAEPPPTGPIPVLLEGTPEADTHLEPEEMVF